MAKDEASNGFSQGLLMDYHPLGTPNTALSNALNATMITYNGNETMLLNDMGNARVETAYLPEGFVPLGTTSFGGIIYIVSYNPLNDTCQIGSFPSPERNFTKLDKYAGNININADDFFDENGNIKTTLLVYPLKNDYDEEITLTPGDKFALNLYELNKYFDYLKGMLKDGKDSKNNPAIKLVLGIKQGGQLRELGETILYNNKIKIEELETEEHMYSYITLSNDIKSSNNEKFNVDDYRHSVVDTNYNVLKCNISGTLCIIAKLVTLDSFMIKIQLKLNNGNSEETTV